MGQAKRNKARLGEWYGRPIVPGHPDYVPPKKPERRAETAKEEPMHSEVVRTLSGANESQEGASETGRRVFVLGNPRRHSGLAAALLFASLAFPSDFGSDPARRNKFR